MTKLLTKDGKVLIKDGKIMSGDECCCEEYIDTCCATCSGKIPKRLRFIETYSRYRLCPCCTFEYDECTGVAGWVSGYEIRIVNEPITFVLEHKHWSEMTNEERCKFFPCIMEYPNPPSPEPPSFYTDYCGDVWVWKGTFEPIKIYHSYYYPMYGIMPTIDGGLRNHLTEADVYPFIPDFITIGLHCTKFNYLREIIKLWKIDYLGLGITYPFKVYSHNFTVNSCKPFATYRGEFIRESMPYASLRMVFPYGAKPFVCLGGYPPACEYPAERCYECGDTLPPLLWYRGYVGEP